MVHQYKNNGYNIVLDVNSGSVHVVDDVVYDVIPMVEEALSGGEPKEESGWEPLREKTAGALNGRYPAEDVKEAFDEVIELWKKGFSLRRIFTKSISQTLRAGRPW